MIKSQGSFITEMEWASFNSLSCKANDFYYNQCFSVRQNLLSRYVKIMTTTLNAENLRQYKSRFPLFVELILSFEALTWLEKWKIYLQISKKKISPCFTLLNILIGIVRPILSQNSKHFHQKLYSNNLYILDVPCNFL